MKIRLKPLNQQVIVITGASSGIGLTTARMAIDAGAKVVIAARNEKSLREFCESTAARGGKAEYVVADVGNEKDVERIAQTAIDRFGGFDTWVNNAGLGIFGKVDEISLEDARKLFDTNFWGQVHGSRVAVKHLRNKGGALINIGSIVSDRTIPMQGMYSATKHAVKSFTDALRMELEHDGAAVVVTLVKPSAIDTPFTTHAKNYMDGDPDFPPPVYAPETVAKAILFCAEHPRRDIIVGGAGRLMVASESFPKLSDAFMKRTMFNTKRDYNSHRRDSLYRPTSGGHERGRYTGHVMESSVYTKAALHPMISGAIVLGAGIAAVAAIGAAVMRED